MALAPGTVGRVGTPPQSEACAVLPQPVAAARRDDVAAPLRGPSAEEYREILATIDALHRPPALPPSSRALDIFAVGLPLVAATVTAGFVLTTVVPRGQLVWLGLALVALVAGHVLLRLRRQRRVAERETDQVRRELALQARVAACESRRHRLAAFSRLAAQIAHEVRNPLSSIVLNTELLEEELGGAPSAPQAEMLGLVTSIKSEAERLHLLTNEYLAFARMPEPEPQSISLGRLVADVAGFVREEAARQGVDIDTRLPSTGPPVSADPRLVRQAVVNLVRNALEAMPSGGRLTLSARQVGAFGVLDVADTGPGVPEEYLDEIFEPFFTTRPQGTGLGLSVAARIVREHGGRLEVRNDGGAVFTAWLPATMSTAVERVGRVAEVPDFVGEEA